MGSSRSPTNYGSTGPRKENFLSVIDVADKKEIHHVDLGPLGKPHGLWFADGKLYFTVEESMAIGRYDPADNKVDWVLGTGQDRTHMIVVAKDLKTIFTSNVNGNTISIIERGSGPQGFGGPPGGGPGGPPPGGPPPDGPPPGGGPGGPPGGRGGPGGPPRGGPGGPAGRSRMCRSAEVRKDLTSRPTARRSGPPTWATAASR